jgi:IMP dehydrogenase
MKNKLDSLGITFDDVLLEPRYSTVVPSEVDVTTRLTRRIGLNIPLLSSPMDTVTESEMAIALGQEGGLGVIHKNMSIERQTEEVDKVKRSANGIITDPVSPAFRSLRRGASLWALSPAATCVFWRTLNSKLPR